jgi:glycosyltransferase involved in cell wall biosynthesis
MNKRGAFILSIIICTRDRNELLKKCLNSLVTKSINKNLYEVQVIDNLPSTECQTLVNSFKNRIPNLHYYIEEEIGLSNARNCGLKKAKSKYVAYIDDDALADPHWVSEILKFIKQHKDVAAFGGPYYSYSDEPIPDWYPENVLNYDLGNKTKKINIGKEWLNGTNMIFKKDLLLKYHGFNNKLGMRGKSLGYGEETELLLRLKKDNIPVYYSPDIKVKHHLPKRKISLFWLLKNSYISGKSSSQYKEKDSLEIQVLMFIRSLIYAGMLLIYSKEPFKARIYHALSEPISRYAALTQ